MSKQEHILAVKNTTPKQGFAASDTISFEPKDVMIGSREWLETDENFLQLIPYCMVTAGNKVLVYSRTAQGEEGRLSGKVSCGLGGHINISDLYHQQGVISLTRTVAKAVSRELEEEITLPIDIDDAYEIAFKGFIYDGSNEVGRVHLGLLMTCELNPELHDMKHRIKSDDKGVNILGFFDPEYLLTAEEIALENWSRIALEGLK